MRYSSSIKRRPDPIIPAGRARRGPRRPEAGYILIIFLVVLTLMMIALTAAAPRLAQQLQRDREIEMIHRGEQYARAIKRYYKKFGRYPGRIEDLENTNTIRFLRQRYKDPITGGPWRLVRYGEIQLLSPAGGVGTPAQLLGQSNNPQAGAQSGLFNMNFGGTSGQQNPATAAAGGTYYLTPSAAVCQYHRVPRQYDCNQWDKRWHRHHCNHRYDRHYLRHHGSDHLRHDEQHWAEYRLIRADRHGRPRPDYKFVWLSVFFARKQRTAGRGWRCNYRGGKPQQEKWDS